MPATTLFAKRNPLTALRKLKAPRSPKNQKHRLVDLAKRKRESSMEIAVLGQLRHRFVDCNVPANGPVQLILKKVELPTKNVNGREQLDWDRLGKRVGPNSYVCQNLWSTIATLEGDRRA